ncbi:MAG: DUF1800 family protein [Flavobacterium sp.]
MNRNTLWSLRLGFSGKQAQAIGLMGLPKFLEKSFAASFDTKAPSLLDNSPKSIKELRAKRQELKNSDSAEAKELLKTELKVQQELKGWWLEKMANDEFPLREKMTCFWHNHFVLHLSEGKSEPLDLPAQPNA